MTRRGVVYEVTRRDAYVWYGGPVRFRRADAEGDVKVDCLVEYELERKPGRRKPGIAKKVRVI